MMFLLGVLVGALLCLAVMLTAYVALKAILRRHGPELTARLEAELSQLRDTVGPRAEIVYPDDSEAIYKAPGTTIDDLLK